MSFRYFDNNAATGKIPSGIGKLTKMEHADLSHNRLSGLIPGAFGGCTSLRYLDLSNNQLEGEIPGRAWDNMELLTTLYLNGNKLTGEVPNYFWLMSMPIFKQTGGYSLSVLNLGDNLLTETLPDAIGSHLPFTPEHFTELWIQGNPWNGPCAALCGHTSGTLGITKRATMKQWVEKCRVSVLESTSSQLEKLVSQWFIDAGEIGSGLYSGPGDSSVVPRTTRDKCTRKPLTCGKAHSYTKRRTVIDPACTRCPLHTFQSKSEHTEYTCSSQPMCGPGESISPDNEDLRVESRICNACDIDTYQSETKHRLTECIAQPFCTTGQKITGSDDTVDSRRVCEACPLGFYQDSIKHRETSCKEQRPCKPGTTFEITTHIYRACTPCNNNEYQERNDPGGNMAADCIAQPLCTSGQKIVGADSKNRGICDACQSGQYQEDTEHRKTSCIKQIPCYAGTAFAITSTEKRSCITCGPNTYQDSTDLDGTKSATCVAQPTCTVGQRISANSGEKRRTCSACPVGEYQSLATHQETNCTPQPTCKPGESFGTTLTIERECIACNADSYQSTHDAKAPQAFCIEQPFCSIGQRMSIYSQTTRRTCSDCPLNEYQTKSQHRSTTCVQQPNCTQGQVYKANVYEERVCNECPDGEYQSAASHKEIECLSQTPSCSQGFGFIGDKTMQGECVACNKTTGEYQDERKHRDACKLQPSCAWYQTVFPATTVTERQVCIDPETEPIECGGLGTLQSDGSTCECNKGFAGRTCVEYSDEVTCNNHGIVSYNAETNSVSCDCINSTKGIGTRCQFNNSATCKDVGVVSANGTCTWTTDGRGKVIVPECRPGYYYNPNPKEDPTVSNEVVIGIDTDGCFPCSPGQFASETKRRVQCQECPLTTDGMQQTSEPRSTSADECFAKFQRAPRTQLFCYGTGKLDADINGDALSDIDAEPKPLSRITSSVDCSASAASMGYMFVGEFYLPYPGCVLDAAHNEARFYIKGATRSSTVADEPKQDTPICENFVCPNPANDVKALAEAAADPFDTNQFPSCTVSKQQTLDALARESTQNKQEFLPAAGSIGGIMLIGSYAHQYRATQKLGQPFGVWNHIHVWLGFVRIIDMMSDFGFYFISALGAFGEAYGDGDPSTCIYGTNDEPKEVSRVGAFLFACVFCTALGFFLTPLDIWILGQRMSGHGMNIVGISIMLAITFFEDVPQLTLSAIYMDTMRGVGSNPDFVAIISMIFSSLSLVINFGIILYYVAKLRRENPAGWWKIDTLADGTSDQTARNAALESENAALKKEVALLKSNQVLSTVTTVSNPVFDKSASGFIAEAGSAVAPKLKQQFLVPSEDGQMIIVQGAGGVNTKSSIQLQPKPGTNDRCKQCHTLEKFCTCNVRRGTGDMAVLQVGKGKGGGTSNIKKSTCVQVTSNGPCQNIVFGTRLCVEHTCQHEGCKKSKSAKAKLCPKHTKTAPFEYLEMGGNADTGC